MEILAQVMRSTPRAVLWLLRGKDPSTGPRLLLEFAARGIAPQRLVFAHRVGKRSHMGRLLAADLMLDSSDGYGAHSTAADALAAGVPFVTWQGG